MKVIDQWYRIVATRSSRNNASEAKSKIARTLKTKLTHNKYKKKINFCEKFFIKVPTSTREALMMGRMNNNTILYDDITK